MINTLIEHLKAQNNTLDSVNSNIKSMNSSLAEMILSDRKEELRRREADDDAKRAASAAARTTSTAGGGGGGKGSGGSRFGFGGVGGALGGFGIGSALRAGKNAVSKGKTGILGRTMIATGMTAAADSIAGYVEQQTGSKDLGDAAHRAVKLGAFGTLLGKKYAVLAAVGGALATDENIAELKKMGDSAAKLKDPLMKFVGKLPTLTQVFDKLSETTNGILKAVNSIVSGDFVDSLDYADEVAVAALGVKGGMNAKKNRRQIAQASRNAAAKAKSIVKPAAPVEFSKSQRQQFNTQTAKGLSAKKIAALEVDGLKVNRKTGAISKVGGGLVSADKVDEVFAKNKIKTSTKSLGAKNFIDELNGKAAAKYGKFGKALPILKKAPILGTLLSGGIIASILMNDETSDKEKAALLSQELGALGGAALGGALGGLIGTAGLPGIGTLIGGIGGAILGAISGEELGADFANWMLGTGDSTSEPVAATPSGGNKRRRGAGAKPSQVSSSVASAPYPQSGVKVSSASSDMYAAQAQQNIVVVDNSNVSNNVSTQAGDVSFSGTTGFDFYDPMMGSRTA